MYVVTPDEVKIWWESKGAGTPVLLAPGRGDCADLFPAEFVDALVDGGCQVVRFDPRDAGLSGYGGDAYSVSTMAEDIVAVLDAAALSAAHLLGFSLSGLIIVDLVARFPQRALTLTFVSAMSPDPDGGFGEQLFAAATLDPVEAVVAGMGTPTEEDRVWATRNHEAAMQRASLRPEAGDRHNAAAFRFGWPTLDDVTRITAPALVIHGDADRSLPLEHAHSLARNIRNARLEVVPGMGHIPTRAEWRTVRDHLVSHVHRPLSPT